MAVASPGTQLPLESAVRSVLVMTRSGSEEDNQNKMLFYLNSYYYRIAANSEIVTPGEPGRPKTSEDVPTSSEHKS